MFQEIKSKVTILDAYEKYLGDTNPLRDTTGDTFTPEDDICPWHGGHGSFRIKYDENDPENGFAKCFSSSCIHDETPADVIEFVRRTLELETPYEAALRINSDFGLNLAVGTSPHQRIFHAAAEYFQNMLMTTKTYPYLEGKTPMLYQLENRKHLPETISRMGIGWTDGQLHKALQNAGFSREDMVNSGLVKGATDGRVWDLFPEGSFIYTHLDRGRPSNFTMKCMSKTREFRLKNEHALNNAVFYGQEDMRFDKIAIVEGENDRAALYDGGWDGGVLASIGTLSQTQIKWISDNLRGKEIHTFFDNDDAGSTYRAKIWKLLHNESISNVHQYVHPEYKDIDLVIRNEGPSGLIATMTKYEVAAPAAPADTSADSEERTLGSGEIVERDGCYYASKLVGYGDGEVREILTNITNFTIEIVYTFLYDDAQRYRVAIIRSNLGQTSRVIIGSDAKTNLSKFQHLMADCIDGIFRGNINDFNNMWTYLSKKYTERLVMVPSRVGHLPHIGGWLFNNLYISNSGRVVTPDEDGIMWLHADHGVKPISIIQSKTEGILGMFRSNNGIPALNYTIPADDRQSFYELEGDFLHYLCDLFGDTGKAVTYLAFCRMFCQSDDIFDIYKFVPVPVLWGRAGRGKSTMLGWMLDMYGMEEKGMFSYASLKSYVGWSRKMDYYCSLPTAVDELRSDDRLEAFSAKMRDVFSRTATAVGGNDTRVVRVTQVNSVTIISGQDNFVDDATKQRCIPIEVGKLPADLEARRNKAYKEVGKLVPLLPNFGFHWILESCDVDQSRMATEVKELAEIIRMRLTRSDSRMANLWACVAHFGMRLAERHLPGFSYLDYAISAADSNASDNQEVDIINHFWESVQILQSQVNVRVDTRHIMVKDDNLYIHIPTVYDLILNNRINKGSGVLHSRTAIVKSLEGEEYFAGKQQIRMGDGILMRTIAINLAHPSVTDAIKNIAERAKKAVFIG